MLRPLLFVGLAVLVSACGGASEPSQPGGLVFSRADGSEIDIPGRAVVWCGPWNDMIPAQALQIAAIEGVERAPGQEWFSYWRVWAIVEDVRGGQPVTLPNQFIWNKPRRAEIFVGDFPTENEASSKQEGSSGRIVFRKATCELGGEVSSRSTQPSEASSATASRSLARARSRAWSQTRPPATTSRIEPRRG